MMMTRLTIPLLAIVLSGCASMASLPPKVSEVAYKPMIEVPEPEQGRMVLAVYQFADMTGQQKPNSTFSEMSKAVTQGASNLLIKALKDVGEGKWFRVAERESLQSLLQERKLIRTTRQMTQGDKAKPLGPMLYAGAYLTGGIVGYDSNTLTGGVGHRFLGIGASAQYRQDTVTVMLRLINVVSGEVELAIMMEKTILSAGIGGDKFKYLDTGTNLIEVEMGIAINEPVTYAVRKTIEGAVVELIHAGEKKGLWKFKPEEPTEEELLEVIEEESDKTKEQSEEAVEEVVKKAQDVKIEEKKQVVVEEEKVESKQGMTYPDHHKKVEEMKVKTPVTCLRSALPDECVPVENEIVDPPADAVTTPAPQPEPVKEPDKVKVELPLSDAIRCESGSHHYRCIDETPISIPSRDDNGK